MKNFFFSAVQLMRADRPIGTILLVTPMLWALWLASDGLPAAHVVLIFMLGAFVMRSAGCVINDFADRDLDLKVKRTKDRALTAGRISAKAALGLFFALIVCALILLFFLPTSAFWPAVAAFVLATLYPFTKRFFIIPQVVLGLAYASSIIMAYVTVLGSVPAIAWVLVTASVLWTVVYDTFYAMVDRDDDIDLGIHSSALWFGQNDLLILMCLAMVFLLLMVFVGVAYQLAVYYYLGLLLALGCFVFQFTVAKTRERAACFVAFLNNQWVGLFIFLGIWLSYLPR